MLNGREVMSGGSSPREVNLTPADIPGAKLSEPWDKHPVVSLRWWLLCRGVKVASSVRKKDVIKRLATYSYHWLLGLY